MTTVDRRGRCPGWWKSCPQVTVFWPGPTLCSALQQLGYSAKLLSRTQANRWSWRKQWVGWVSSFYSKVSSYLPAHRLRISAIISKYKTYYWSRYSLMQENTSQRMQIFLGFLNFAIFWSAGFAYALHVGLGAGKCRLNVDSCFWGDLIIPIK